MKIDFTYPKPSAPSWILFGDIPRGANISVEDFPQGVKGMRLYIDRKGIDLTSSVYVFHDNPGIYRVSAAYVDLLGEGYRSAEYACTIKPTFDGKWIEDGTLSIAQMDSAVSEALSKAVQSAEDILDIDDAIAGLQESNAEITATLINTKNTLASQIRQTADSINATVANKEKNLLSQISAQAGRISSVVTGLSKNPSESGFSAITQLQDGINLRVKKDDIINQINMTTEGTKIDGKYLHVTGTTKFDNDVITEGMIKAGSITADKLSSSLITLGGEQGIAGGAVTLDAKGLTVRNHDGRMTKFDESGMAFFDRNGNRFSQLGRMLIGEASDGDYVKFGVPWDIVPNIIVVPKQLTLNHPDFPKGIIETRIGATDVSSNGFRVQCQSILGKGSAEGNNILTWSAMILPGKVKPRPYPAPNYKTSEALEVAATLRFSRDFTFSNDATDIVLSGNVLTNIRTNPSDIGLVRVQILYEGKAVYDLINFIDVEYRPVGHLQYHTWVYRGLWDGILPVTRSYWPWNLNTAISLPIKFNESRTVTLKVLGLVTTSQNNNLPTPIYINLFSNQTVDADTVLSRGQAMFIASENNSFYTITR